MKQINKNLISIVSREKQQDRQSLTFNFSTRNRINVT